MARTAMRLYVPAPRFRPGDTPDFGNLQLPAAGAAERPDPMVDAADTRDLAFNLIRVLDEDGRAVGPWKPDIKPDKLREGLKTMMLTRAYDDRMLKMQRQGKMSFYMKSLGEEAVAVAAGMALKPDDMLFPSYRQQGLLFVRGRDMVDMMCHCISNSRDNLKGRQLPVHYTWAEGNFFSISGNLCTQFPQAVGYAMASAYKGEDRVTASWIGEGSSAEGDFHVAGTLASIYRPPVILNVVNNQWAISMFHGLSGGERSTFAARAIGYGIPGLRVDGNDFLAVWAATKWAAERARRGGGATMLEIYTYRGESHSTSDDPSRYRPKEEWQAWPLGDPVERLKDHLIQLGEWSEDQHKEHWDACVKRVTEAWREAVSYGTIGEGPYAPTGTMFEDVYKEMPPHLRRQRQMLGV
ncbi:MAG: thiamine pyrophosphate-dependent enzyme [Alphaproteobacteria bacterium]